MKFKKLTTIALAGCMVLGCIASAAAYNAPLQFSQVDITQYDTPVDTLSTESDRFVVREDGTKMLLLSDTPNLDKSPDPRHVPYDVDKNGNRILLLMRDSAKPFAVAPPTTRCPTRNFNENWSNTQSYAYTKYYFHGGTFTATANTAFVADFYTKNGVFLDSVWAWMQNGKYTVNTGFEGTSVDYYVILTNKASTAAKNATYFGSQDI